MQNYWASSLFKGRIGEAVVESVLSEFGYQVARSGQEFHRLPSRSETPDNHVMAPDLAVTDPKTGTTKYVEVKFRSARPMSAILEKTRLEDIRRYHPGTILIFVSAYNGSVNCASVDDISEDSYEVTGEFAEFDLTRRGWRPIWDYFPLVQPGVRLQKFWAELNSVLHEFAEFQVSRSENEQALEDERNFLEDYIEEYWLPGFENELSLTKPTKDSTINDLWEIARKVLAVNFAVDLHDPEEEKPSFELIYIINRILNKRGESQVSVDLEALSEELLPYPELHAKLEEIRSRPLRRDDTNDNYLRSRQMVDEVLHHIPKGVGKAYLGTDRHALEGALEIDLRTMLAFVERRNRLDVDP